MRSSEGRATFPCMAKAPKTPNSFRLSEDALRILRTLAEYLGVSQAAVIEMALRELARKEKVI